jgi:hypothetical protein
MNLNSPLRLNLVFISKKSSLRQKRVRTLSLETTGAGGIGSPIRQIWRNKPKSLLYSPKVASHMLYINRL